MLTADLKSDLHKMIEETNDPMVLKQVAILLSSLREEGGPDWWDLITEEEKKKIEEGQQQLLKGALMPYENVRDKARKILETKKQRS